MGQEQITVITRKGQITVPVAIRRALGIREGDRVALSIREGTSGEAILRPVRSVVEATYGMVTSRGMPADLDGLRERFEVELAADAMDGLGTPGEVP